MAGIPPYAIILDLLKKAGLTEDQAWDLLFDFVKEASEWQSIFDKIFESQISVQPWMEASI